MWIKTNHEELVNLDRYDEIRYDSDENITVAELERDIYLICSGNAIPNIIRALKRGDNYVGVE